MLSKNILLQMYPLRVYSLCSDIQLLLMGVTAVLPKAVRP
jgi:hypothetical protein